MFNKKLKDDVQAVTNMAINSQSEIIRLNQELSTVQTELAALRKDINTITSTTAQLVKVNERKLTGQNSKEPWVELLGDKLDDDNRLQVELDWNEAFVRHLKDQGFTGNKDDEVIRKWLSLLLDQIVGRMEATEIQDNTDEPNKFV